MTPQELSTLDQMASTAAKVGATLAVWQIIILIAAGKIVNKMWILINQLQLIVFVGLWSISYTPVC